MRVSTNSFSGNFLYEITQLESQQSTLQGEATTGLQMTLPEDNPAAMNQVLNLQNEASANTQYQSNISQIQATANTSSDALNSLQTLLEQAGEIATEAGGVASPTQLSTYATQVGNLLKEALALGNTTDANGNYIFGGTANGSPPFTATYDANGNITGVTYNGNTSAAQTEIAPGLTVSAENPGQNNTGSGPGGVFADSRTGADVFGDLIALQQNLLSGTPSAVSPISAKLTTDENNVVTQISANAVLQSTLQSAGDSAQLQATNVDTEMSNDTNADLAQTLTKLQQTQTAYQASLQSGAMVMQLSLMEFLS